jgi:hypothetical protein
MRVAVLTEKRECTNDDVIFYSFQLHLIEPRSEGQGAVEWLKDIADVPATFNELDTPTLRTALWGLWLAMSGGTHFPSVVSAMFDVPDDATIISFIGKVGTRSWEDDTEGQEYVRLNYGFAVRSVAAVFPTQASAEEALRVHKDTVAAVIPPDDQHLGLIFVSTGALDVRAVNL